MGIQDHREASKHVIGEANAVAVKATVLAFRAEALAFHEGLNRHALAEMALQLSKLASRLQRAADEFSNKVPEMSIPSRMAGTLPPSSRTSFASSKGTAGPLTMQSLKGQTILVVDDDEVCRLCARELLWQEGATTIEAVDGVEALFVLGQHRVDALLLDYEMPNADGLTTATEIRAHPSWQNLPIVLLTAYPTERGLPQSLLELVTCVIAKPLTRQHLRQAFGMPALNA